MSSFIKFECDLENFINELKLKIENNNQKIENLLAQDEKTYANFVKPLEIMEEDLGSFFTPLSHLNAVNNSDKEAKKTSRYNSNIPAWLESVIMRAIALDKDQRYELTHPQKVKHIL